MSILINSLNTSLIQESNHAEEVLARFLDLIKTEDVRSTATVTQADWKIGCFSYKNAIFTAAYSELQESVRVLSLRVNGWVPMTIMSTDRNTIELAFCSWLDDMQGE